MKRYKPSETVPKDGQSVVVRTHGSWHKASWDSEDREFYCYDHHGHLVIFPLSTVCWWMDPMKDLTQHIEEAANNDRR